MIPESDPAQPIIARFAVCAPTGRQRWRLVELPLDDAECAAQGYNVIGPALDLGVLPYPIRRELWDIAADPDRRDRLNNLLGRLPRWTCPGYDVDGDDHAAAEAIAEAIVAAELLRGVSLRVSRSSGSRGAGLHLEFGATTQDAASVDLFHVMLRRAGMIAREAGLEPRRGSAIGHGDTPLTWVLPGHEGACLDLIPLNHGPCSKQRLFRPLGGLNKHGDARKCLAPGSPTLGSPITREILAQAPPPPKRPYNNTEFTGHGRFKQEDWTPVAPVGRLAPLIRALSTLRRPGDNHDLRLALCAVAQVKRLLTRESWVNALGHAWGDRSDAAAAWDSTAERLQSRLAVRGATWLRARIGTRAVYGLAKAVAEVADQPISGIFARFGRPTADHEHLDLIEGYVEDTRLIDRVATARRCLQFQHHAVCTGCDVELYRGRIRCGWSEACPACAIAHLRSTERWLRRDWPEEGRYVHARFTGYATREEGLDDVVRRIAPAESGQRPLRLPVPQSDGSWEILAITGSHTIGAAILRGLCVAEVEEVDQGTAVKLAIDAVAQRMVVPIDHLEHGRYVEAAELLEDLYCTHRAIGVTGSDLCWPSTSALRRAAQEVVEVRNDDCSCAAETPECHHYDHLPTGARVIEGARYPQSIATLVSALSLGQSAGLMPLDPPELPRRRTPMRE